MADLATTVSRWQQSAGSAQTRYAEGIQASTVDVVARAVAAKNKLVANFNDAVNRGAWERGLQDKGTAGWKAASIAKANNYSTGIQAGVGNYQTAMNTWLPIIMSVSAQVQSMPNNSFADSLARMQANATLLHNQKLAR